FPRTPHARVNVARVSIHIFFGAKIEVVKKITVVGGGEFLAWRTIPNLI
ncbi:MAG: hypothetical protein RLZZ350_2330, partial [Verrucomicrobiota bacterium]